MVIVRKDGAEVTVASDDYVFHSQMTDTVNAIARTEFEKTYKLDVQGGANTAESVSLKP